MAEKYELEKWVWTEADFEQMGWHDARIHAIAFLPEGFELVLDIDYILRWVQPAENETRYKLWVAPATLVFENVHDLRIDLEPFAGVEIQDIHREDPQEPKNAEHIGRDTEWRWVIEAQEGEISLRAVGYKQYFRSEPALGSEQSLEAGVRGGFSFGRGRRVE
jgi:hypothetical protein